MPERKTILVTGGGGNIGKRVIPYLQQWADIVSLDLKPVPAATRSICGSVTNRELVFEVAAGADAVLHMAYSNQDYKNLHRQVEINLNGTVNVLDACVKHRIPRLVIASSVMTVMGDDEAPHGPAYHRFRPYDFYGLTKCAKELMAELYTRDHDFLSAICLRIGGPKDVREPFRLKPPFRQRGFPKVLLAYEDLCAAFRLALLAAPEVKYATLFLVSDYGDEHFDVKNLQQTLGFRLRWRVTKEADGSYLLARKEGAGAD